MYEDIQSEITENKRAVPTLRATAEGEMAELKQNGFEV